ncbi:MAG: hypothetical protein AB7S75_22565 [Desulfococcaceae bacterium]
MSLKISVLTKGLIIIFLTAYGLAAEPVKEPELYNRPLSKVNFYPIKSKE